ncbi:MAG TPA: putative metal-dependent hydrolase [Pedobacter sp.]|jgi:hypothetical protein
MKDIDKLRYPIGRYFPPETISNIQLQNWIDEIEQLPLLLRKATDNLSDKVLNIPYRPEGWTLRQVIHHLADSHINAYIRFKLAVTEDNPTIKPYFEDRWAKTSDSNDGNIDLSLNLLEALHKRWVLFLRSMSQEDWIKTYYHPANNRSAALKEVAGLYAWHGNHHLNHILMSIK